MNGNPDVIQVQGRSVALIRVRSSADEPMLQSLLRRAGLPLRRPVVVLVGGADGLKPRDEQTCRHLFAGALVPVIEELHAVLVDGGTDSGIMRLAGQARHDLGASEPHVGVVAAGTVRWPSHPGRTHHPDIEPHHTHIVAVPGDHWGDETPWISLAAAALSDGSPSITVLANGGDIAYEDVRRSLLANRPVLVLAGTGRIAARLALAKQGLSGDTPANELARSHLLTTVPNDINTVRSALSAALRN